MPGCPGRSRASSSIPAWTPADLASLERALDDWQAQVVLNCIGIIKQSKAASDPLPSIAINSLLPHQLAQIAAARGARLIHFSTDCVFSGRRGNYVEDDEPDPVDLYGRSKLLGEVTAPNALTLAHVDRRPRAARAPGADRLVPVAARRPDQRLCPRALQRAHHAGRGGPGGLADPRPSRAAGRFGRSRASRSASSTCCRSSSASIGSTSRLRPTSSSFATAGSTAPASARTPAGGRPRGRT